MPTLDDDAALVRDYVRTRDEVLFADLVERHQANVLRIVAATLGRERTAEFEDVVQNVFIEVYRTIDRFRFRSRFSTWLYRLTKNRAIDYVRQMRFRTAHVDLSEIPVVARQGPDLEVAREQAHIRWVVGGLPPKQRMIVNMFYWLEMTVSEIADLLNMRSSTVKSYLFRARRELAKELANTHGD